MSLVAHDEMRQTGSILSGPVESRDFPDWFREQQREAWKQFESLPSPTRKDQLWRFSNVNLLDLSPFKFGGAQSDDVRDAILEQSRGLEKVAARLIFAGDQLIERDVISDQLKKRGVIFQPLERAMVEHVDLFRKNFMSQPAVLGSAKFAALHKPLFSSATFLYMPPGVELAFPLQTFPLFHLSIASHFP